MAHIESERLRQVLENDLRFTDEEFDHLRVCAQCYRAWASLVHEHRKGTTSETDMMGIRVVRPSK